ncbi:MAG: DUF1653 domain-containing protein [Edwardsiella phage MSW-3]|uniref:Uncharacterized protein n=1 Tax=Edwardsiella phage MSW-3 TaxID=1264700 RepID=L0MYI4_9CAUD|nr:hypothetical protein G428_gp60 [Edwardsiella phage MSW-3]BAM68881.1 hypothetical protein [Edwardsiella phage MSW-3]BEU28787.1 MAG: DUF1653 domain-containing protein [Edwardsiella phage MSW-3]
MSGKGWVKCVKSNDPRVTSGKLYPIIKIHGRREGFSFHDDDGDELFVYPRRSVYGTFEYIPPTEV